MNERGQGRERKEEGEKVKVLILQQKSAVTFLAAPPDDLSMQHFPPTPGSFFLSATILYKRGR